MAKESKPEFFLDDISGNYSKNQNQNAKPIQITVSSGGSAKRTT